MIELGLEEFRKYELDILDYIVNTCKANNLRVTLDSGTLIGAVRHKGFIPWDDDVDLAMPRTDYNKLIDILKNSNSHYKIFCPHTNNTYYYPFAKVVDTRTVLIEDNFNKIEGLGVNVDVFPIDDLPNDESECRKFQTKIFKLRRRVFFSVFSNHNNRKHFRNSYEKFLGLVYSKLEWRKPLLKLDKYVQKYNSDDALYCEELTITLDFYHKGLKKYFDDYIELEFEGKMYPAIKEYDSYLRNMYGDYMQLPPEEERVAPHYFTAYFK